MATKEDRSFSVGGLNARSVATLVIFVGVIAAASFLLEPTLPLPAAILVSVLVVAVIFWLLTSARVTFQADRLVVGGGFYQVRVPLADILLEDVKELPRDSSFKLRWRTNGLGWPGLSLGWFTTNHGKRVFAAISNKERRVYIPLRGKYDLVVTPESTQDFLSILRSSGVSG